MQRAYAKVAAERPDIKPVSVTPSSSSFLSSMLMPKNAMATTNPFTGNINYNPSMMVGQSQPEMEQTIAHELTHVGQTQNTPWYKTLLDILKPEEKVPAGISESSPWSQPYYWRPNEMQSFQAERDRAGYGLTQDPVTGSRDILLRSNKPKINVSPSQMPGGR